MIVEMEIKEANALVWERCCLGASLLLEAGITIFEVSNLVEFLLIVEKFEKQS